MAVLKLSMLGSVGLAIYTLIVYLYNFNEDIKHYKPLWKFLSIKIVLFLSIWQRIVLKVLRLRDEFIFDASQDPLSNGEFIDSEDYIDGLLVSFEMFLLSLVANYCFSFEDFKKGIKENSKVYPKGGIFKALPRIL